jgi:hypothetical protein
VQIMARPYTEYRHQARICMQMADSSRFPDLKAEWLSLAGKWLELIPPRTGENAFETMLREKGTEQKRSNASH